MRFAWGRRPLVAAAGGRSTLVVGDQFVLLRVIGIVFLCLGAALAAIGLRNAVYGASMISFSTELAHSRNQPFDASTLLAHWRVWNLAIACTGSAMAAAGVAVTLGKRWGLLILGIVLLIGAIAPWVVQWLGLVRFPFERAGLADTMVLTAFALLAIWGYFLRPERRTDA